MLKKIAFDLEKSLQTLTPPITHTVRSAAPLGVSPSLIASFHFYQVCRFRGLDLEVGHIFFLHVILCLFQWGTAVQKDIYIFV